MGIDILNAIFEALDMLPDESGVSEDDPNVLDIVAFTTEVAGAYKQLELSSWTFAADERQIVWMLLGYFYVPGAARYIGMRSMEKPLDKGMPGGNFWYLPRVRTLDGGSEFYMPVAQVLDWLLDLLGMSREEFADHHDEHTNTQGDGLRRTIYNWMSGSTPQPEKIKEFFPEDLKLKFKGTFELDADLTPEERFSAAMVFVQRKNLTADTLRQEIPMGRPGRLEQVLTGQVSREEQAAFVGLLLDRYSVPTMRIVRQRLLIARAVQHGYIRLLNFLCPGVDIKCVDAQENKILQLCAIYESVHNLSCEAAVKTQGKGEEAENDCFDRLLPELGKYGIFLSIAPSLREVAMPRLALLLSRHFFDRQVGDSLQCLGNTKWVRRVVRGLLSGWHAPNLA